MPPAFGHRIVHGSVLSHLLNRRGVATLRFDLSNHPGLSEGDAGQLALTSAAGDILAAVDAAGDLGWEPDEIVVVAPG